MFTIKVTYHGQTRKHSFDINTFPTYEQICSQLYRVFNVSHSFYLSKLLFSPNSAQSSHILIATEVHNSMDYNKCIRQHKDRVWRHGLLRFNMCDIAPSSMNESAQGPVLSIDPSASRPVNRSRESFTATHNRISVSAFPSAAIPSDSMDVDRSSFHYTRDHGVYRPQHQPRPLPQHRASAPGSSSCCSVSQGKSDIQKMLVNFQDNLNRVLASNLGMPMMTTNAGDDDKIESAPPPSLCSTCTKSISRSSKGPDSWFSCSNCHVVVCDGCYDKTKPGFCLCTMGPHNMQQGASLLGGNSFLPIPRLPDPWTPSHSPAKQSSNQETTPGQNPLATPAATAAPSPVVHDTVICDVCNHFIAGVRHKCLDCANYDLCTSCISSGAAEAHNPFHEFFDITEPGRVIVHTVFSGDGERETPRITARSLPVAPQVEEGPREVVIHHATCDLCDSRIIGDRYKCLTCPDFDTCSSCFSITQEQHPDHSFARLQKADDYIYKKHNQRNLHYATCDGCSKTISGVRYKCMHPECPDYDLCENCEALPIPVHPSIHPMLKMKTADTVVPTVYRVGQTTIINQPPSMLAAQDRSEPRIATPVEDERVKTPTAMPPLPAWMALASTPPDNESVASEASEKPPVPPKPEMMSNPTWASIQGFFPPQRVFGDMANPFSDSFAAPADTPKYQEDETRAVVDEDISLPSVPKHIPNPWPTTNATERQELLQLIADFSSPSSNLGIISALSNAPRRSTREDIEITTTKAPLIDISSVESSIYTHSSRKEFDAESTTAAPNTREFLPNVSVSGDLFNSLFQRIDGAASRNHTILRDDASEIVQETSGKEEPKLAFGDFSVSMSHLLQELDKTSIAPNPRPDQDVNHKALSVAESSFSHEPLLHSPEPHLALDRTKLSLEDLVGTSLLPSKVHSESPVPEITVESRAPLSAAFVEDVTVPDGQVFPPGAEFVKCWRLLNDSGRDWPETTQLVFVAGEMLSDRKNAASLSVDLGKVAAGSEVDAWTGELKAPEIPGRYVGYWRLKANGEIFGNSLWIEINVVEADSRDSSDVSLAASAIIMPVASSVEQSENAPSLTAHTASFSTSVVSTDDNISDPGSDISLISMPSTSNDEELWHDSRSQTTAERQAAVIAAARQRSPATAMDYVMLYEESSSEDEK